MLQTLITWRRSLRALTLSSCFCRANNSSRYFLTSPCSSILLVAAENQSGSLSSTAAEPSSIFLCSSACPTQGRIWIQIYSIGMCSFSSSVTKIMYEHRINISSSIPTTYFYLRLVESLHKRFTNAYCHRVIMNSYLSVMHNKDRYLHCQTCISSL